ncbi:ABC transporter ATP-binding protein [Paenibacillus polygoni]|uniref:ABC transporter ATP-binding protein n=1 Tax=Paenibacillus polygoni TaxID=3050112 RepID=A0ABY8WXN5_9BACL|nr:ABC transporter ATP-binding protein [Paenibacillus polygoni]WIV17865.1 ABC transporter ATP-binding protein [Paenibacillus polygoni]
MNLIEMKDITHVYVTERGAKLAIESLHLEINEGEFISLVGPSGCGKTTLLSMIAGLLFPTKGEVRLSGDLIKSPSPKVGYMLQQDYLYPWRTIQENILIGLEITGQLTKDSAQKTSEMLANMGLAGTENLYPSSLSGGMRQRVALVRTLATSPDLLLLDEPFSALDYQTKLQLEDLISDTLRAQGKTAILVTHDLSEAIAVSDKVIVLDKNPGRIRKIFIIPDGIRKAQPFYAREQTGFNELFNEIWRELEDTDGKEDNR